MISLLSTTSFAAEFAKAGMPGRRKWIAKPFSASTYMVDCRRTANQDSLVRESEKNHREEANRVWTFCSLRIPNTMGRVKINMDYPTGIDASGPFEARYLAFLETITHLRPSLHRYCSRMTGSVLDGEDVVQDALFQAYRKLDTFEDDRPLKPWLFRIAHNQCIDFLRRREVRQQAEAAAVGPDSVVPADPPGRILGQAVEHLVLALPPKERACVLLKDVFDYSLVEIAELVDTTVGGVKAALNRGRSKLASLPQPSTPPREVNPEMSRLLHLYVERFNRRDWDGLRQLITADARLRVADRFAGPLVNSPYFGRYERVTIPWRMAVGEVDGQPAVITLRQDHGEWIPHSIVRVDVADHLITRVADYAHCPWVLPATTSVLAARGETSSRV
jgi:RNA polymerase sigma-70 factor (ECF subfamily)